MIRNVVFNASDIAFILSSLEIFFSKHAPQIYDDFFVKSKKISSFIEKNAGRIRIESEVGKGSRFLFTLPGGPGRDVA